MGEVRRTALVLGHPGHELRAFQWMIRNRPAVFILTDGSGSRGENRISQTLQVLALTSSHRAGWLEAVPDREIYRQILDADAGFFVQRVAELARYLVEEKIDTVAGDMIEGYNPSHDLCRHLINAAVELARRKGHTVARNLAFPLTGLPGGVRGGLSPCETLQLDEAELGKKIEAALNYPALREEVEQALTLLGKEAFAVEAFYDGFLLSDHPPTLPLRYEQDGEKRTAAGIYKKVIRFAEHMKPLIAAIRKEAGLTT